MKQFHKKILMTAAAVILTVSLAAGCSVENPCDDECYMHTASGDCHCHGHCGTVGCKCHGGH